DPLCDLGSRDDHHAADAAGDGVHVGIAAIALEGLHVRVHREYVVPRLLQPAIDQIAGGVVAPVARHAHDRAALLRQEVERFRLDRCGCHGRSCHREALPSACPAAAQIVWMSSAERRASGCSAVQAPPGILPADAAWHDASSSWRCRSGEYAAHSEKLTALRPSFTPYDMSQDTGATWVYQGHTVRVE